MEIDKIRAEASGPFESLLLIQDKLRRATFKRGNLFLPPRQREGVALLRPRALSRLALSLSSGKRFAVAWCTTYDKCTRLWEGTVISCGNGSSLIRYDVAKDCLFPFPPKDSRILIQGGKVATLKVKVYRKRFRNRKCCSRRGVREQKPMISAMNEGLNIGTLNIDTLKVKSADVNALRKCLRLQKVVVFMKSCKAPIFGLQETRLTFESSEPIVHRKLYIEGIWLHVYLMSAINGYNGMAFISRMQLFVEKVSDRIMKGTVRFGSTKATLFNVYSPIASSKQDIQEDFNKSLFDAWHESNAALKIICGDFNAPLQNPSGRKCSSKRAKALKEFLESLGAKSAHETCTSPRKWTFRFPPTRKNPDGKTKQLDHIVFNSRFCSAVRLQRVMMAPCPTPHCAVIVNFQIRWKTKAREQEDRPYWDSLKNSETSQKFNASVKAAMRAPCKRSQKESEETNRWGRFSSSLTAASKTLPKLASSVEEKKSTDPLSWP